MNVARPSSTRRRADVLALALVLATLAGACGRDEPAPVTAARGFAAAVQTGDVERILELAESGAVAHLNRAAESASDQVGGRRNVEPHEMLQVVDVDPMFQIAEAELVRGDEASAVVALIGADGTRHELTLVQEDGQWRVRVPVPAGSPEES